MKEITTREFNERVEDFETIILRFGLFFLDEEENAFEINFTDECDQDTKQILSGFNEAKTIELKKDILKQFIDLKFDQLFLFSHANNLFFDYCSFAVYELTFESRFLAYKNIFVDTTKTDFAKMEFQNLLKNVDLPYYLNKTNKKRYSDSFNKKCNFLETILSAGNIQPRIHKRPNISEMLSNVLLSQRVTFEQNEPPQQPEPEPLDLSNTKGVEKIIYLNELGIIDFLRSKPAFALSTNLMATFLSAITGEKPGTLQSSLNRLVTNDTEDKNHPYKRQNTVDKVRQTLIDKNIEPKTS